MSCEETEGLMLFLLLLSEHPFDKEHSKVEKTSEHSKVKKFLYKEKTKVYSYKRE